MLPNCRDFDLEETSFVLTGCEGRRECVGEVGLFADRIIGGTPLKVTNTSAWIRGCTVEVDDSVLVHDQEFVITAKKTIDCETHVDLSSVRIVRSRVELADFIEKTDAECGGDCGYCIRAKDACSAYEFVEGRTTTVNHLRKIRGQYRVYFESTAYKYIRTGTVVRFHSGLAIRVNRFMPYESESSSNRRGPASGVMVAEGAEDHVQWQSLNVKVCS